MRASVARTALRFLFFPPAFPPAPDSALRLGVRPQRDNLETVVGVTVHRRFDHAAAGSTVDLADDAQHRHRAADGHLHDALTEISLGSSPKTCPSMSTHFRCACCA